MTISALSSSVCIMTDQEQKDFRNVSEFICKLTCCRSCTFCCWAPTKERFKSCCKVNEVSMRCFLCRLVEFSSECHKCPSCCSESTCRSQIASILGKMDCPRGRSLGHKNPQRRLHSPLPDPTESDKVTDHHQ